MKEEMKNLAKKAVEDIASKPISRKEAIKKTGYMAVSAATMMLLLNNPAQANRPESSPAQGNNGWGNGDQNAPGNSGGHNNAENGQSKIWKKK
jgi:hypothetical protein